MSNFIKLSVVDGVFDHQYINMDLVQEIIQPIRNDYGARLIFSVFDPSENDYTYADVAESVSDILSKT